MFTLQALPFAQQIQHLIHDPITLVFILAAVDILTGLAKALLNKEFKSNIFKKGLITHTFIVVGLYLFEIYANDFELEPLIVPIATAFAFMYISSIFENYRALGGKLPSTVEKLLSGIKDKSEEKDEEPK